MLVSGRRRCIASIDRPIVPKPKRAIWWGDSFDILSEIWRLEKSEERERERMRRRERICGVFGEVRDAGIRGTQV